MAESKAAKILKELQDGVGAASKGMPKAVQAYLDLEKSTAPNNIFDSKTRELMVLAQAVQAQCKYCIVLHTYQAIQEGASKEEIYEAASVAIPFGGSKSFAYSCAYLTDAVETFWNK